MCNPKRVLIFGLTGQSGGVESFVMNYYRNIDREKIQFDFISFTDKLAYKDEIENLGGEIYTFISRNKNPIKNYIQLNSFFKKNHSNYIAVHLHLCDASNIDVLKLAKKYNIPIRISHSHNSNIMSKNKIHTFLHNINIKKSIQYSTDYFACSNLAGKWFFNNDILNNSRYRLIKNAVNCDTYNFNIKIRNEVRDNLNIKDKFVIGNVARFHHQKNHFFIIDVFNKIYSIDNSALLLLIGEGELLKDVKEYVNKLNLSSVVKFLGIRYDISDLMQAMDVFLLPSLYEGLPIVGIEAQATSLPCVFSSSITSEVQIVDNVTFINLDDNLDIWAKKILNYKNIKRYSNTKEIIKSGYEIKGQAKLLQNFYLNFI